MGSIMPLSIPRGCKKERWLRRRSRGGCGGALRRLCSARRVGSGRALLSLIDLCTVSIRDVVQLGIVLGGLALCPCRQWLRYTPRVPGWRARLCSLPIAVAVQGAACIVPPFDAREPHPSRHHGSLCSSLARGFRVWRRLRKAWHRPHRRITADARRGGRRRNGWAQRCRLHPQGWSAVPSDGVRG